MQHEENVVELSADELEAAGGWWLHLIDAGLAFLGKPFVMGFVDGSPTPDMPAGPPVPNLSE
jgi:hypothetical protein